MEIPISLPLERRLRRDIAKRNKIYDELYEADRNLLISVKEIEDMYDTVPDDLAEALNDIVDTIMGKKSNGSRDLSR